MWRKGKKRADEDSDGSRPSKKPARSSAAGDDDDDNILVCEMSKNRRVAVRLWQGKVVVDIREFYEKDGKLLPGKKGISLPMDQWKILRDHVGEINKAVKE